MFSSVPFSGSLLQSACRSALQGLAAALIVCAPVAHADDYADVNRLIRAGQLPEALSRADQYLASKPRDPQMRFIKGVIQTEAGRPAEAVTTFTKITEDYPELPEPYNNLAVLYAGQNQFDKARAALEMAIRTNPSYATAHENLGDVYAKLASQAYSKALQLDSNNAGVQPKLALIRTLFAPDARSAAAAGGAPVKPATIAAATTGKPAAAPTAAPAPATAPAPKPAPAPTPAAPPVAAPAPAPMPTPTPAPVVPPAAVDNAAEKAVQAAVHGWAEAWSAKDVDRYLASYGPHFQPPGNQSRKTWEADRRLRIVGKSKISVKLSNLVVTVKGALASARFKQDYSADSLKVSSRKTLELAKAGERWLIVRESTGN